MLGRPLVLDGYFNEAINLIKRERRPSRRLHRCIREEHRDFVGDSLESRVRDFRWAELPLSPGTSRLFYHGNARRDVEVFVRELKLRAEIAGGNLASQSLVA